MITVVIPTVGRPTLRDTLAGVGSGVPVIVVDDTRASGLSVPDHVGPDQVRVVRSGGRGPAAARNAGWRAAETPWVVFLDDDVVPSPGWAEAVWKDLVDLPEDVAGSQGRIEVPLPADRRPTDAERNTAGLADALWVTADMAYRRSVLESVGGFDERFPRAYREDADLALRVSRAGHRLVKGARVTAHPVREDGFWASVRFQRGNADDALMRRLHGPGWRTAIGGGRGRLRLHAATTAAALAALTLAAATLRTRGHFGGPLGRRLAGRTGARLSGRPGGRALGRLRAWPGGGLLTRPSRHGGMPPLGPGRRRAGAHLMERAPEAGVRVLAGLAGAAWAAMTAEFAWRRIAPGPRTPREMWRMVVTSVVIPPVACVHRLRGEWRARR
ncbi:glycosyltransferase family 2 protein [Nonomuraea sp. CA-141351]|uniref:glycosyltransferase family 2 protein n=1 Tax=Nonomuraea sp. CA-141351 TaxID=3239996 RepID=UPI003D93B4E9